MPEEGHSGCCSSCCRCLASVPGPSLCSFIFILAAATACGGSMLVAVSRSRLVLDQQNWIPYFVPTLTGLLVGTILIAVAFLAVSTVSSSPTAPRVVTSTGKNLCARVINILVLLLAILLQFAWVLATVIVAGAVMVLLMFDNVTNYNSCVHLRAYGLPPFGSPYCDAKLVKLKEDVWEKDLLLCYMVSCVSALLVTVGVSSFLLCTMSNYSNLKQSVPFIDDSPFRIASERQPTASTTHECSTNYH